MRLQFATICLFGKLDKMRCCPAKCVRTPRENMEQTLSDHADYAPKTAEIVDYNK